MNILSDVSETAIITLRARTIESQKNNPVICDEMSSICLEKIGLLFSSFVQETCETRLVTAKE